ncbi:MAG: hotdog fold thioesterase [Saprospiraceae bacterium]|nr:hotdog fold thioesterase [Candidatus Vicinibacter affinis]
MTGENIIPEKVLERMFNEDGFSQWLGIEKVLIMEGHCILRMKVRKEMLNGFMVAHGGISYSLADSAFAFSCNSYNKLSLSIETSISHSKPIVEDDVLTAESKMITQSNKIGNYQVLIKNQNNEIVAVFNGICYRTEKQVVE